MIITRTVILGWMELFIYLTISYRTTLVIIFIVDSFVDCFLHELIDCCKKKKKIFSQCLFCPNNLTTLKTKINYDY